MCEADKERVEERPEEEEAILEKVREWRYCSFSSDCIITVKPSEQMPELGNSWKVVLDAYAIIKKHT